MSETSRTDPELRFRIGAVSRQAGIPTETIRAWERRYNVVEPTRESGRNRLYSQADIDRLTLIKQLVDQGFAIGTIAHLGMEELREKMPSPPQGIAPLQPGETLGVVLVGEALKAQLDTSKDGFAAPIQVNGAFSSPEEALKAPDLSDSQVVIVDAPTIHIATAIELRQWIRELGMPYCIVCYQFGSREAVDFMRQCGFEMMQGAPAIETLQELLLELTKQVPTFKSQPTISPRQFSRDQLIKVSNMSNSLKCECPRHTADLVLSLDAFETYSLECENQNDKDAELHAKLYLATSRARAIMEEALRELADHENLDI